MVKKITRKDDSNNKNDKLIVRIDTQLKGEITKIAESNGTTVSDYVRQLIVKDIKMKNTNLIDKSDVDKYIQSLVHETIQKYIVAEKKQD